MVAYTAAGLHVFAALSSVFLLRAGLPSAWTTAGQRLDWVEMNRSAWLVGWIPWMLSGPCMVLLLLEMSRMWGGNSSGKTRFALTCAVTGMVADLTGQMILILGPSWVNGMNSAYYSILERVSLWLMAMVGNGGYTIGFVLLVLAGKKVLPGFLSSLALLVGFAGLGMCVAVALDSSRGLVMANMVLLPSISIWTWMFGAWLRSLMPQKRPPKL